jgi:hypothetical protein
MHILSGAIESSSANHTKLLSQAGVLILSWALTVAAM